MEVTPEYELDEVLKILTNINEKATNIKINMMEIQIRTQKVIIESLKGGH